MTALSSDARTLDDVVDGVTVAVVLSRDGTAVSLYSDGDWIEDVPVAVADRLAQLIAEQLRPSFPYDVRTVLTFRPAPRSLPDWGIVHDARIGQLSVWTPNPGARHVVDERLPRTVRTEADVAERANALAAEITRRVQAGEL